MENGAVTMPRAQRMPDDCARLRILATSDVHTHLAAFDYGRNCAVEEWGLTRTATKIKQARAETPTSILLDNGDFLQGTALADIYSEQGSQELHPVLSVMEHLEYDAIGLGNHEFNYGLDRLSAILSRTNIPILCANLDRTDNGPALAAKHVIIERKLIHPVTDEETPLRIGVLSVLPPQIMKWDGSHLLGKVAVHDQVEAARSAVAELKAEGADIVVALAHTGIDPDGYDPNAENAALALAGVQGIDALITGHTHRLFPQPDAGDIEGADNNAGTLHGVPCVMPGFRGSHLGIIDLDLQPSPSGWDVTRHTAQVEPVAGPYQSTGRHLHPPDPQLSELGAERRGDPDRGGRSTQSRG
jgi:2',3'-cyclic-nucleotide 2'-phosphodiesterase/3'-nucleotidase